jgi:ubiquinone/menaquinone biosynthesis C-methylase UbiE
MKSKIKILSSQAGYDLASGDYDKKEKYLNSFENGKLLPLLGDIKNKKILDVGAGTGRLAVEFAEQGACVTALDVSSKMLERLKKKNKNIEIIIGDGENLPFKNEEFDIVIGAFLIVHFKDPLKFFDEAYRVLKNNGLFIVTNINQKEPPEIKTTEGKIKIESYYHRPEKVREILNSLAFNIEKEIFVKEGDVWINQILLAKK